MWPSRLDYADRYSIDDQACCSVGCSPPPRRAAAPMCRPRSSAQLLRKASLPATPAKSSNTLCRLVSTRMTKEQPERESGHTRARRVRRPLTTGALRTSRSMSACRCRLPACADHVGLPVCKTACASRDGRVCRSTRENFPLEPCSRRRPYVQGNPRVLFWQTWNLPGSYRRGARLPESE